MNKKILIASVCMLIIAFSLAACGKNGYEKSETTTLVEPIEYSTDESGNKYVTNVNGEMIPVTTDVNGYIELYVDLINKTAEQAKQEAEQAKQEAEQNQNDETPKDETPEDEVPEDDTGDVIVVGDSDNASRDAVIDWR